MKLLTALETKLALEDAVDCLVVLARERPIDYGVVSHLVHHKRCRATHSGLLKKGSQYNDFLGSKFTRLTVTAHDRGDIRLHAAEELHDRG